MLHNYSGAGEQSRKQIGAEIENVIEKWNEKNKDKGRLDVKLSTAYNKDGSISHHVIDIQHEGKTLQNIADKAMKEEMSKSIDVKNLFPSLTDHFKNNGTQVHACGNESDIKKAIDLFSKENVNDNGIDHATSAFERRDDRTDDRSRERSRSVGR